MVLFFPLGTHAVNLHLQSVQRAVASMQLTYCYYD